MAVRNVYLKIETIPGYSPVEPDDHVSPPIRYRRKAGPRSPQGVLAEDIEKADLVARAT
jgi:hypothetical protein